MSFTIKGKVVLVTGGASGIGLAYVKEFLKNAVKGVAIVDINTEGGLQALDEIKREFGDNRCAFIQCDVSVHEKFQEAFEQTVNIFKQLDIVVNNAGVCNEQNWQKCISINLVYQLVCVGDNAGFQFEIERLT